MSMYTTVYVHVFASFKGTIQRAPRMGVMSIYFRLNICKLYNGPIRLLVDHDFTVRCIQVHEAIGWYLQYARKKIVLYIISKPGIL